MTARYLNIVEKQRQHAGMIASIADFTVSAGDTVAAGIVLNNPNVSLYCFDPAAKTAIFVELPDGVNLASAPFVYMVQYEQAQRLIEIDYETFKRAAQALPKINNLIMIYITGRSGSTLLSHVFNELDEVISLSEPDVGTQFLHLRHIHGVPEDELRDLLDCALRVLFKPTAFKTPTSYALKLRSEAIQVMDLYQATFPGVKNLYLYRDVLGFVNSFYRVFKSDDDPDTMPASDFLGMTRATMVNDFSSVLAYLEPNVEQITLVEFLTLWWIAIIECYLTRYERGFPILAVNYPDLSRQREATLRAIFDYCGLPVEQIQRALGAFERDSQAGTFLARENPAEGNKLRLSEAQIDEIKRILVRHPVIKTADFVVPGTLEV